MQRPVARFVCLCNPADLPCAPFHTLGGEMKRKHRGLGRSFWQLVIDFVLLTDDAVSADATPDFLDTRTARCGAGECIAGDAIPAVCCVSVLLVTVDANRRNFVCELYVALSLSLECISR